MTDIEAVTAQKHCSDCGEKMKAAALFCTVCGTRVSTGVGAKVDSSCSTCHADVFAGASFCTKCGTSTSAEAIDLTVEDKEVSPPKSAPADRVSPAASRAILTAVGAGMGSYVGSKPRLTGPGQKPPPPRTATAVAAENRRRRIIVTAVVAAVLVLTGAIAVAVVGQHDDGGSLRAGQRRKGSSSVSSDGRRTSGQGSDKSTTTDAGTTSVAGGTESGGTGAGSASGPGGATGTKKKPSTSFPSASTYGSPTTHGGAVPGIPNPPAGGSTAPNPPPPIVTVPGPARLQVSGSVSLSGANPVQWIVVANAGGQNLNWSAGMSGIPGVEIAPSSGTLRPGEAKYVKIVWSPWAAQTWSRPDSDEGAWNGTLAVNSTAGNSSLGASADNRASDTIWSYSIANCVQSSTQGVCAAGSTINLRVIRAAAGSFTGAKPASVKFYLGGDVSNVQIQSVSGSDNTYPSTYAQLTVKRSIFDGSGALTAISAWVTDGAGVTSSLQNGQIVK